MGQKHPFWYREHLLELWRTAYTTVPVSRLACAFAHESYEQAKSYATQSEYVYRVMPESHDFALRADMLWLTWMGEAGATPEKVFSWCSSYWSGAGTGTVAAWATPSWEWLFPNGLRVEEVLLRPSTSA